MGIARVAFLRGINVGGHRVSMDDLRAALEPLELGDVRTFIASGNVVFDEPDGEAPELEVAIGRRLEEALGYAVETFVRGMDELRETVWFAEAEGLGKASGEGWKPHVVFTRDELPAAGRTTLAELETDDDRFLVYGREVVWMRRGGLLDSTVDPRAFERALERKPHTMRTLNTVGRIVAKFGA